MSSTQYFVTGMKCDGCIKRATEALNDIPGFESAEFDLNEGVATINGDVDPQAITQTLTETGYPATVKSA